MQKNNLNDLGSLRQKRKKFVREFSWAIPNIEAIKAIRKYAPIVEIGSGGGYWGYLIEQDGTSIELFDNRTDTFQKIWKVSQQGGPEVLSRYFNHSLLLCWPPYNSTMASDCLRNFQGKYVIYIGEPEGGCTADDDFFMILKEHFKLIETVEIPQWPNIHDSILIYKKK